MGNDGGGAHTQIISPSALTGFGVPCGGPGGTSTALTVASGACSITVTSPISMPFSVCLTPDFGHCVTGSAIKTSSPARTTCAEINQ